MMANDWGKELKQNEVCVNLLSDKTIRKFLFSALYDSVSQRDIGIDLNGMFILFEDTRISMCHLMLHSKSITKISSITSFSKVQHNESGGGGGEEKFLLSFISILGLSVLLFLSAHSI